MPRKYSPGDGKIYTLGILGLLAYVILDGVFSVWMIATILIYNIVMFCFSEYKELKRAIRLIDSDSPIELYIEHGEEWEGFYEWVSLKANYKAPFLDRYRFTLSIDRWHAYATFDTSCNLMTVSTITTEEHPPSEIYEFEITNNPLTIAKDGNILSTHIKFSDISRTSVDHALLGLQKVQAALENREHIFITISPGILTFPDRESIYGYPISPTDVIGVGLVCMALPAFLRLIFL